ncbi:MAG: response regulator [Chitinophagaceae bacterium]|nr:response regulator [Chitinophagaceae bacterium]
MKQHVLLIDDDEDEMTILFEALRDAGIDQKCTWAHDVDHALKMLPYLRPEIIFIDLNMPVTNGLEGIRLIRALPGFKETPVILYSTHIETKRAEALQAGADYCIKKPSSIEELTAVVADLFRHIGSGT